MGTSAAVLGHHVPQNGRMVAVIFPSACCTAVNCTRYVAYSGQPSGKGGAEYQLCTAWGRVVCCDKSLLSSVRIAHAVCVFSLAQKNRDPQVRWSGALLPGAWFP